MNISYSKLIYDKEGELIHASLSKDDQWRMFIELNEITPELKKAIIEKEDKYFYKHLGINPLAIGRALFNNIAQGKRTSGASTITMQVARMLDRKERTYWNKTVEMFNALQLEINYSKEEILQLYLNKVPYGGNIEGIKAASFLYFNKKPDLLSLSECVALAVIPNDPSRLRPGKCNVAIKEKRDLWLDRFMVNNVFDPGQIEDAKLEAFDHKRRSVARKAPHFSRRLSKEPGNNIHTFLDLELQQHIEEIVKNYSNNLRAFDIHNIAVLLVENDSNRVVSYVGSSDFYNGKDAGQVDGVTAIRSPGSTLKPFLYGLAFDKGSLTPLSVLHDVPTSFGNYQPENYDGGFKGEVSVTTALSKSLNVPAVKVLEKYNTEELKQKLIDAKFKNIERNRKHLGLSMILGGCGVTLEELVNLYSSFAKQGKFLPLNYTDKDGVNDTTVLLSSASAFMLSDILMQVTRPDLPGEWQNTVDLPAVAWKTGTSYGRKDAWSIGYNDKYTLGVWAGNFSGKGVPELSGAEMASPLFFDIFNFITKQNDVYWHIPDDNLHYRTVCTATGKVPGEFCTDITDDLYLPGISPYDKCQHLKKIFINADSTISFCNSCLPDAGFKKALYPNLDPEILNWKKTGRVQYKSIPKHNTGCERNFDGEAPKILHPIEDLDYYLSREDSTELMLQAQTSSDIKEVFWYVNNRFLRRSAPDEKVYFNPPEGKLKISCSDDKGRNRDIEITVKKVNF